MKIYKADIKKRDLNAMSVDEQVCFIQAGRFINEISMFNKLISISTKGARDDVELKAQNTQSLSLVLLFIGKLNECLVFLKNTYGKNPKKDEYDSLLSDEAKQAYLFLKKYSSRRNYMNIIRKKLSFHHDDDIIKDQLLKMPDDETLEIYFHDITGNCLYHMSSMIILRYILDMVDPKNHENALKLLMTEILNTSNMALEFLNEFIRIIAIRHGEHFKPLVEVVLGEPPSIENMYLPYFIKK